MSRNNATGNYGYYIYVSNYSNITDCFYTSGRTTDIHVNSALGSIGNIFLNCSYNNESINGATNNLIRKWYYQAYVNYSNGTAASDANVSAYNTTNIIQFTEQTNSTGWIDRQELIEYVNTGGTKSYYSNYTINASKTGYVTDTNVFNFTIQQNKIDDFFTLLTSTCTYLSGNWEIDCNDNCSIISLILSK